MAESIQVSCISKNDRSDAYEKIQCIGGMHNGFRWKLSLSEAILGIEQSRYTFYTRVNGHKQNVIIASRNEVKYLKTEADTDTPDNLLSLTECY